MTNVRRPCPLVAVLAFAALLLGFQGIPGSASGVVGTSNEDRLAVEVAGLVTSPSVFELTPATVAERFRPLLVLESASKTEYLWSFAGAARDRGVTRARADFQPAGPGQAADWSLLQIEFDLAPRGGTSDGLYRELHVEISERLGAPTDEDVAGLDRRAAWMIGEYREIAMRAPTADHQFDGPGGQIIVSISVLQGEPEN